MAEVPIRVFLDGPTFLELEKHAAVRGTNVGGLLAMLARASIKPKKVPRPRPPITDAQIAEALELRKLDLSWREVGARLGVSHTGIRRAVTERAS